MLKVTTEDGEVFVGEDEKDVVRQMRNTQWNAPIHKRDYIRDVVERVEDMTGVLIDPDAELDILDGDEEPTVSARDFLRYLEAVDLIRIEEGKEVG